MRLFQIHLTLRNGYDDYYHLEGTHVGDIFDQLKKNFYLINVDGNPELNLDDVTLLTIREVA